MATAEIQLINRIEKDLDWFSSHLAGLQEKYANRFVAVKEGKIIAAEESMEKIINALERKKENPATTFVEFVHEKGISIII